MTESPRIPPDAAREKVLSGEALLVCAYDDDEKFRKMHLENAISLKEFKDRVPLLSREQEIIFY